MEVVADVDGIAGGLAVAEASEADEVSGLGVDEGEVLG